MNRNITIENLMMTLVQIICRKSKLEIETVVTRYDEHYEDVSFINNIYEKDGKIVFNVYDFKKKMESD